MRAFTACLLALCLAQGAMAAKKQQVTFSPPPPPGPQTFTAPGVSLCCWLKGRRRRRRSAPPRRRSAPPRRQAEKPNRATPPRPTTNALQMDFSFIIPGYTAKTFSETQGAAVCAVLKAKAGGECADAPGAAVPPALLGGAPQQLF